MFSRLFSQLVNSVGIVFRTFRAFFTRQIAAIVARFRRLTSFSRQAAKMVPKAMSSAAVATKKPTKREDYIETQRLFIAKSLLVILLVVLVAGGLLIYYVGWPWAESRFFTAHIYHQADKAKNYSGKAVLYYDEGKTIPMQEGRLTEGVLTGAGQTYDENGLIQYAGNFTEGVYDGKGKFYEDGELVYEGTFLEGKYDGAGTLYEAGKIRYEGEFKTGVFSGEGTLYEDGKISYSGGFLAGVFEGEGMAFTGGILRYKGTYANGLYDGEGALYSEAGKQVYRGAFREGMREGNGVEYIPATGEVKYRGSFMADLYDGSGTLYNDDATLLYEGSFQRGSYHGDGKLYMEDNFSAEAAFDMGHPLTDVKVYREGKLYYEGQAEEFIPQGEGTLYASNGTAVYTGPMKDGTIDSAALLGKTAEEARAAFADAPLQEARGAKAGFSINNALLGVTLFSSLKTDSDEPTVRYVYQYGKNADFFMDRVWERAQASVASAPAPDEFKQTVEKPDFTGLVPFAKVDYARDGYYYADHTFVCWSDGPGTEPLMLEWIAASGLPGGGGGSGGGGGAGDGADRLDGLLGDLGLGPGTTTKGKANPYYGDGETAAVVPPVVNQPTLDRFGEILTGMVDYLENAEAKDALDEAIDSRAAQLKAAQDMLLMGRGDEKQVAALETELGTLELSANRAKVGMERAKLAVKGLTGYDISAFDLSKVLFVVDPADMDVSTLISAVRGHEPAYVQEARLDVLELELAHQEIKQAQDVYDKAVAAYKDALTAYEMGNADAAAKGDALYALSDAKIALYGRLCAFTRRMLQLNSHTGGWLARTYDYYQSVEELDALPQEES